MILTHTNALDIAWYLKQEVEGFLKYLHYYKLKNIEENIEALNEYLLFLDNQSSLQIKALDYDLHFDAPHVCQSANHVHYYVSQKWLMIVGEEKIMKKIWENDYNLTTVMQGIKWFLLLTVDEFCNASPTRMFINRMLWQKETEKVNETTHISEKKSVRK